jgi:hypothetical protein
LVQNFIGRSGLDFSVPSKVRSGFVPCPAGKSDLDSFHALHVARSGFASCSAGRSGLGLLRALQAGLVSQSGSSTMLASVRLTTDGEAVVGRWKAR